MPWKTKKPTAADISPDWLQPYCKQFLQKLADPDKIIAAANRGHQVLDSIH
jgi:hypothetical protein